MPLEKTRLRPGAYWDRGSTPLASKYFEIKYLRGTSGRTDNKSDNTSGVFRHYPVAYSPKSAASFSLGNDLG